MKVSELKNLQFFQNSSGTDDLVSMSLNCFDATVYTTLKNNKNISRKKRLELFVRDINPVLWYHPDSGLFRLCNQSRNITPLWREYIGLNIYTMKDDKNAMSVLENLLDKNDMVLIQTVFYKLPFINWYDPNAEYQSFVEDEQEHVLNIVAQDQNNFYYAEKIPYNINKSNFIPSEQNKYIGVISKKEMDEVCRYFLRCYTLEVSNSIYESQYDNGIGSFLKKVLENYEVQDEENNGYIRCYGRNSLYKLKEFCMQGKDIKLFFQPDGWTLPNRVAFDIWMIFSSRQVLREYFLEINKTRKSELIRTITDLLYNVVKIWVMLSNVFAKRIQTGDTILTPKNAGVVDKLIDSEETLFGLIKTWYYEELLKERGDVND